MIDTHFFPFLEGPRAYHIFHSATRHPNQFSGPLPRKLVQDPPFRSIADMVGASRPLKKEKNERGDLPGHPTGAPQHGKRILNGRK